MINKIILIVFFYFFLCPCLLAKSIEIECAYNKEYSRKLLSSSERYIELHPNENTSTYTEAQFYLSDNKSKENSHVQLSIDTQNKSVADNLNGFMTFNNAKMKLTEYTDKIFIEYYHKKRTPKDKEYLVERLIIDRKNGYLHGERYDSYVGLDQSYFPNGELVYNMMGTCKPYTRLF